MHRRVRLTLLGIAAYVVAVVLAALVAMYLLLQPQRFTNLLRTQAQKAGLALSLATPAEPTLWPQPALVLHGLTLSADNRPVLVAARARLVLPWRTLLGGPTAITRLELDTPRVNLAQLGPVLAHLKPGNSGKPSLPHIDAGIRVTHGSLVRGRELLLNNIHLETGPLSPGHIFSLQLTATTAHGDSTELALLMTPHVHGDSISLDNIHITASAPPGLQCVLDGKALWRGGSNVSMSLHGKLRRSPQRHYLMALAVDPAAGGTPLTFHLTLHGPGLDADLRLPPVRLMDWWRTVGSTGTRTDMSLPPVHGTMDAKEISFGGTHIKGLHLSVGQPAASASSRPASAASAAVRP